ncbi:putative transcriptional regulator [Clostridium sp. ASBs410]|nr:putative transcriptional regulator [Clostridium sp. ASBs410]
MIEIKHHGENCPLVSTMNVIGGKWKIPILWYLAQSPQRYNQLKRCIDGITNTMLTRALRDLEEDGLVERIQYEVIPPQVEYRISEKGNAIMPAVKIIESWGKNWLIDGYK